jgi:hypothetical protein
VDRDELRALEAPLKERYAEQPADTLVTLSAVVTVGDSLALARAQGDPRVQ